MRFASDDSDDSGIRPAVAHVVADVAVAGRDDNAGAADAAAGVAARVDPVSAAGSAVYLLLPNPDVQTVQGQMDLARWLQRRRLTWRR